MVGGKKKRNNKGFTLIELIVASAVSLIVMLSLVLLLSGSLRQFKMIGVNANLQRENQIAQNQVGQLIREAIRITKDEEDDAAYDSYTVQTGKNRYRLVYDVEKRRLLLGDITEDEQSMTEIAAAPEKNLMAEYITGFSLTPEEISSDQENAQVVAAIHMTLDGKTLNTNNNYALRNGEW